MLTNFFNNLRVGPGPLFFLNISRSTTSTIEAAKVGSWCDGPLYHQEHQQEHQKISRNTTSTIEAAKVGSWCDGPLYHQEHQQEHQKISRNTTSTIEAAKVGSWCDGPLYHQEHQQEHQKISRSTTSTIEAAKILYLYVIHIIRDHRNYKKLEPWRLFFLCLYIYII